MAEPAPLFVGLDVHKESIAVADADGTGTAPPVFLGQIGPRQSDLQTLLRRLQSKTLRWSSRTRPVRAGLTCTATSRRRASPVTLWHRR